MAEWKILIADSLHESGKRLLASAGEVDDRAGVEAEELLNTINGYHALIVRGRTKVTRALLEAGKTIKVVGRAGVGVDNIDLAAAQANNVIVVNAPTATTTAVAEHSLGLILAAARQIPQADAKMKTGLWAKKEIRGIELSGKTLGIIGIGNIGVQVAERAAAFGMRILAHDPFLDEAEIEARGAVPVSLDELYTRADFITLHLPLTPETRGILNGEAFASMKRGVYLICAARGGVIEETALLSSLESGQVAGAALDVFANEPPGLTALVAHPNVVATPHVAGQTNEAQARAALHIAEEVIAALEGGEIRWRVV